MRIIHTATYHGNKTFRFWELTVEGYCRLKDDSENFLASVLTEFGEAPKLKTAHIEVLLEILTAPLKKGTPRKEWERDEWHILLGMVMRELHQDYESIMKMPMRVFLALLDDLDVIAGTIKLEEKRKDPRQATREFFGGNELKSVS